MSTNKNGTMATPYPLIDPDPSLTKIIGNFSVQEYAIVSTGTVVGYVGAWLKSAKPLRVTSARFAGILGLTGGFCISWLLTLQRFQGLKPNQAELFRYGRLPENEIEDGFRRIRDGNVDMVDPPKRK